MGQVSVTINSCCYEFACGDGEEERVRRLAEEIAALVADLVRTSGQADPPLLLLMAALTMADRLDDARADLATLAVRIAADDRRVTARETRLAGEMDGLAARIRAIADRLAGV